MTSLRTGQVRSWTLIRTWHDWFRSCSKVRTGSKQNSLYDHQQGKGMIPHKVLYTISKEKAVDSNKAQIKTHISKEKACKLPWTLSKDKTINTFAQCPLEGQSSKHNLLYVPSKDRPYMENSLSVLPKDRTYINIFLSKTFARYASSLRLMSFGWPRLKQVLRSMSFLRTGPIWNFRSWTSIKTSFKFRSVTKVRTGPKDEFRSMSALRTRPITNFAHQPS